MKILIGIFFLVFGGLTYGDTIKQMSSGHDWDLWAVTEAGDVYYRTNKSWMKIQGQQIDYVSANSSNLVWAVDANHNTYIYENGGWSKQKEIFRRVEVGDGGDIWAIGNGDQVYTMTAPHQWMRVDGSLHQLAVAPSGDVWGVNASHELLVRRVNTASWQHIPGTFTHVSVSPTEEIWVLDATGKLYQYINDSFQAYPITADTITGAFNDQLWVVPRSGYSALYFKDRGNNQLRAIDLPFAQSPLPKSIAWSQYNGGTTWANSEELKWADEGPTFEVAEDILNSIYSIAPLAGLDDLDLTYALQKTIDSTITSLIAADHGCGVLFNWDFQQLLTLVDGPVDSLDQSVVNELLTPVTNPCKR